MEAERDATPILLLDDVFSELDSQRAHLRLHALPEGQSSLTTASGVPAGAASELVLRLENEVLT